MIPSIEVLKERVLYDIRTDRDHGGMGPLVTAMSAEASDMSSYLLMGIPGLAYLSGVADASWTAIGLAIGTYLNFLLVARRLRRYSVELDAITIRFDKTEGETDEHVQTV